MEQLGISLKSKRIEKELRDTTGNEFERNAQFILHLIYKNYRKTRLSGDGGVDGYIYTSRFNKSKTKNERNQSVEYFTIYGPETKTQMNKRIQKLSKDFDDINAHAEEWDVKISRWYIVLNFDVTAEIESSIMSLCEDKKIKFEILYPMKLVKMLDSEEELFKALAFTDQVEYPSIPATKLHYHEFTKRVLQMIVDKQDASTTEQLTLLNTIYQDILFYVPKDEESPFYMPTSFFRQKNWLIENTKLYHEETIYIHEYDVNRKKLYTYSQADISEDLTIIANNISIDSIFIKVIDLSFIYSLIRLLRSQIVNKHYTKYNLKDVLEYLYDPPNFSTAVQKSS